MKAPELADYGLTDSLVEEIHARERRAFQLFVRLLIGGCSILWVLLTAVTYTHWTRRSPFLGLLVASFFALVATFFAGLPVAAMSALFSIIAFPRHPQASALERYELAASRVRTCDVCVLARGDHSLKDGVTYCGKCAAWICGACRSRYDFRAIAALRRRLQQTANPGGE